MSKNKEINNNNVKEKNDTNEIVKIVFDELINRGLIVKQINTKYDVKCLLRSLPRLKKSNIFLDKRIKSLNKSKNKISGPKTIKANNLTNEKGIYIEPTLDNINNQISEILQSKEIINTFITYVDTVLKECLSNKDYDVINNMYELNDKPITIEELATKYNCDTSYIYKIAAKAIKNLNIELFPEKFIKELYLY